MLLGQRIAVVVPAFNEAPRIARVLTGMPAFVDDIIVVDDASTDGTAGVAHVAGDARVRVLRHGRNQGVGAALRHGYDSAFSAGAQVAAVMAGDGQMDPRDLQAVLLPVLRGEAEYAKGDRLAHPDVRLQMPRTRLWGNRALSRMTRWATGLAVDDSQCGYTALAREAHERVPWGRVWSGYGYPNDLLGWLALQGARVRDVVVRPVYADEVSGIGWRHALLVIPYVLLRVCLRAWRGRRGPQATGSACASGY